MKIYTPSGEGCGTLGFRLTKNIYFDLFGFFKDEHVGYSKGIFFNIYGRKLWIFFNAPIKFKLNLMD